MTEVEKLRALLAEARRRLRWYVKHDGTDEASDGESKTYFKGKQRAMKTLVRIDAALAESPSGDMGPDVVEQRQVRGK